MSSGWVLWAIKKPRSFSGGVSVRLFRSFDYARTAPEPPEGALVFVVVLVEIVMARTYAAGWFRRQRVLGRKSVQNGLNGAALSRHKLPHEPPQPFRTGRHRWRRPYRPPDDAAWRGAT